ncbi:hypothetical protein U9M48_034837, partial [Paspalum notatum var. saurae]
MFKFENWWLYENDFQEVSREAWQKSTDMPFYKRTKHLGFHLQRWSRKDSAARKDGSLKEIGTPPPSTTVSSKEEGRTESGMELVPDIPVSNIIRDDNLIAALSKEEILNILKSMRGNAALGSDGLNVVFYRAAWSWIGDDVYDLVKSFYLTKHLPQGIKKTNIVLIPKK